ncbi:hypothetical protein ASF17_04640 [Frigoribacterium sp. Leaf263]|uniref:hypothetical protein n=1 Tax=Frigoribacterium sp. Leaf263 TaxID=1736313 RepID=UPI0006F2300E|nr:hypothetical protein [Frigoribacterium sp. Leaf263]KQO82388.1 hypothetical protein ASF17_04640 [Frigoribacterium sp. Leaf263]
MPRGERDAYDVVVEPRRTLATNAVLTSLAALVPVGVALLWLTWSSGLWPVVVALGAVAGVIGLVAHRRYLDSFAALDAQHFVKRGWLPGFVRVRRDRIAEVVVVSSYVPHSTDVVLQLVAFDAVGVRLFRMRGHYWPDEAIMTVHDALGAASTVVTKPVSLRDFYRAYPHARYWYEGRPGVSMPIVAALFALATGALVLVYGRLA